LRKGFEKECAAVAGPAIGRAARVLQKTRHTITLGDGREGGRWRSESLLRAFPAVRGVSLSQAVRLMRPLFGRDIRGFQKNRFAADRSEMSYETRPKACFMITVDNSFSPSNQRSGNIQSRYLYSYVELGGALAHRYETQPAC
jgi:hypothetical protein